MDHKRDCEGPDPETYRRELLDMGASTEDANATVEHLQRHSNGGGQ